MTVEADDARVASLGWQRSPSTYGSDVHSEDIKKVAIASAIGNMIEYYDFTLYATATALVFNKIFFPSFDPLVGSLAAFATFFIGYCARPLGGVLFGHLGDRIGRKTALLATILIMGFGTVLIGLMPSYDSIGIWAPVGLIILRMLQGIGIGGEYGGGMVMTIEHAPLAKRGFYSSLVHVGVPAGFLIPILLLGVLSTGMSEDAFLAWGWRLPFLFSIVLVGIGLFIRVQISETPAFKRMLAEDKPAALPAVSRSSAAMVPMSSWASVQKSPRADCSTSTRFSSSPIASANWDCRGKPSSTAYCLPARLNA
jgi:MHS family shikimate/dehydroshikimate transporter-like MFS transporter